jgi:hypothetical protein
LLFSTKFSIIRLPITCQIRVKRTKAKALVDNWIERNYPPVRWADVVSVLESLGFSIVEKRGAARLISHPLLIELAPEFGPMGVFIVDAPHTTGAAVNRIDMKKKIVPAIRLVLEFGHEEEGKNGTDD